MRTRILLPILAAIAFGSCESSVMPETAPDPSELLATMLEDNDLDAARQLTEVLGIPWAWPPTETAIFADQDPRCRIIEPATQEERDEWVNCVNAAVADPTCKVQFGLIWLEIPETGEFNIIGAQVRCMPQ